MLFGDDWDIRTASPERFVRAAFQIMLRRDPEPPGLTNYLTVLEERRLDPDGVLDEILTSMELRLDVPYRNILRSLHQSRCDFVRMLPRRGGSSISGEPTSRAMPARSCRWATRTASSCSRSSTCPAANGTSSTAISRRRRPWSRGCGPVQYRYHSMVDLSPYPDASFDLVFSGQTIEHITEDEAKKMLAEIRRVLVPGGWFCLDTPNRRVTALQLGADVLSNPDHKLEYTHEHLSALLGEAGFDVVDEFGLSLADESLARGAFDLAEVAANHGVYAEIADCYFLAYMCRTPAP